MAFMSDIGAGALLLGHDFIMLTHFAPIGLLPRRSGLICPTLVLLGVGNHHVVPMLLTLAMAANPTLLPSRVLAADFARLFAV